MDRMSKTFSRVGFNTKADKYNRLNRFGHREFNGLRTTREYIFFTKPDLNILKNNGTLQDEISSDPIFNDILQRHPLVLRDLQRSINSPTRILALLYNSVRNSLELPGIQSKEIDTSSNLFGTKISYRRHSYESDENHDFSLDFEDDKTLAVYSLFKAWDHYNNLKSIGIVSPRDIYRDNMELHDQISIFKILVDETNSNIVFMAKCIGTYPRNVPREQFSDLDKLVYSVQFKCNFVEDTNPMIVTDFNKEFARSGKEMPLYDVEQDDVIGAYAGSPYIDRVENKNKPGYKYKLKWRW